MFKVLGFFWKGTKNKAGREKYAASAARVFLFSRVIHGIKRSCIEIEIINKQQREEEVGKEGPIGQQD